MMQTRAKSIKTYLLLLILSILLPILILQAYSFHQQYRMLYNQELEINLEFARAIEKVFEVFISGIVHQEAALCHALTRPSALTLEEINAFLATSRAMNPSIKYFAWTDPEGIMVASDFPAVIGSDVSRFHFYIELVRGKQWAISDLYVERALNEAVFSVAKPAYDDSGVLRGILIGVVEQAYLRKELSIQRSKGGAITILDSKGILVFRLPSIQLSWEERNWRQTFPFVEKSLEGQVYTGTVYNPYERKNRILSTVPLSFGWVVGASRTEESVSAPIYALIFKRVLIFLAVAGMGALVAVILANRISKSVLRVRALAEEIGHGKYDHHFETYAIRDIQVLSDTFNTMTEQIRLREMALKKEKGLLEGIMKSTDVMLAYLDRDFNFLAVNPAYAAASRRTPDELIGNNHFDLFPNEENEAIFKQVRETGETVFFKDKPFEFADQPERGITYWDWSLSAVKMNDAIVGVTMALRETTRYKKAQDQLLLNARILDSMSEGVLITDEHLSIVYNNTAEEAMFGYAPGELIGKHVSILNDYSPEENARIVSAIKEQLLGGGLWQGEWRNVRKDGTVFFTYSNISRLDIDHRIHTVAVQWDITEEKKMRESLLATQEALRLANEQLEKKVLERTRALESANAKLRALASELVMTEQKVRREVASVLHDHLQQMLASAKFQAEVLPDLDHSEIGGASDQLSQILADAIKVSRDLTAQLSPTILFEAGLAAGLGWLARWMKANQRFDVHLEIEGEIPEIPDDITNFLFECARELIFNAVKHSGADAATVTLRCPGEILNMIVSDEGRGLAPEKMEPSANTTSSFGLFSIRERIQLFHGRLEVDSAPGKGARFSISIPV